MAVKVDELYSNLNNLLHDICKFLTDEANYEQLSPYARKQADELISRSKKQLQQIAKAAEDSNEYDGAYVDMERKVEEATVTTQTIVQPKANPYANLAAKDLSQDFKFGAMSWKCKIILKFEKMRRIYAGVHDNWFLVYSSEKDPKPLQTFNLKFYKAQPVVSKQNKSPSQEFELISTLGGGRSYYFLALTHKDMLQWTSHINRCYDKLNKSENVSLSEEDISETYDMIAELNNPKDEVDKDEEDIYHDIETYSPEVDQNPNKPPDLPAWRGIKANIPLPPVPTTENNVDSSDSFTFDLVQSQVSLQSNSSFSEDEEDNIYEQFVSKPIEDKYNGMQKVKEKITFTVPKNISCISGSVEKPKTATKPNMFTEKTRHFALLRK